MQKSPVKIPSPGYRVNRFMGEPLHNRFAVTFESSVPLVIGAKTGAKNDDRPPLRSSGSFAPSGLSLTRSTHSGEILSQICRRLWVHSPFCCYTLQSVWNLRNVPNDGNEG